MERVTRSILRNKVAGPVKRKAVKGYLVHRCVCFGLQGILCLRPRTEFTPLYLVPGSYQWLD